MTQMNELSDDDLVRAAQGGGLDDFTALYDRFFPVVYNRVRFVVPPEDVEDVTQEVFIAVVRSLSSFRYEARFSTWLRTLVNRQVADYYRSRRPQNESLSAGDDQAEERYLGLAHPDPAASLDDQIIIRQALHRLPEHYREIILLRFAEGLPFEQIAKHQCQSLEAVKSLFRRAMQALQNQMRDDQ
jgi:RNA polymerase sigma-70 factor (ECF subfamily)